MEPLDFAWEERSMISSKKNFLVSLVGISLSTIAAQFKCDDNVPAGAECACVPDPNGDSWTSHSLPLIDTATGAYGTVKDCSYDCCPLYNCDPNTHKCMPSTASGYKYVRIPAKLSIRVTFSCIFAVSLYRFMQLSNYGLHMRSKLATVPR